MSSSNSSIENIYKLNGKVPVGKAIPFGLQHILAMFVANIAPIIIVGGASGLSSAQTARLIQSAMIIAGIGTLISCSHYGKSVQVFQLLWVLVLLLFLFFVISDQLTDIMPL